MELKRGAHRVYLLTYHMIFVTKYRRPVIDEEICDYIKERMEGILAKNGGTLLELNSDKDHIHILFEMPPDINLSLWIRGTKAALSRKIRDRFPEKLNPYLWGDEFWTDSYFLTTTGGATIEVIKQYIENQGEPKRKYVRKKERENKV